ncbi:MAG: beta-N-acetylhexosaminidase, partial [Acidobacteria bacterium]
MRLLFFFFMLCSGLMPLAAGQPPQQISVMPVPASFRVGTGQLVVNQTFSIALTGEKGTLLERVIQNFVGDLSRKTGMRLDSKAVDLAKATLGIRTEHVSKEVQELGEDESYNLEVSPAVAQLSAPTTLGILHGLQTFLQLVETTGDGFAVPVITIHDKPRFAWRGLMIDVSRHFIPLGVLKRNLDGMAAVKLNVFHWHLSDNQGFRVESKKFPKLHELGSDGLYYTQDEVRELIAYARERGIRVVPEFDMPGHSTAWFVGYPELASAPGP